MSDAATMAREPEAPAGYAFVQLEPSPPLPRDAPDRILALATAEGERIREQARAEGHAEGRAQGHRDGLAETATAASAMGEALRELQQLRVETAEAVERDAVELALALAAKVLAGELEAQPERVLDVVRGALRRVADRRQVVVLVDPDDLDVVSAAVGELRAQVGGIELCDVQADRRIGRGGAIVRTAEGEIDATVKTQLERARELLLAEAPADGRVEPEPPIDAESEPFLDAEPEPFLDAEPEPHIRSEPEPPIDEHAP